MSITDLQLHRVYKFNGKAAVVTHEFTAAAGHKHIKGYYVGNWCAGHNFPA
jgi:hypothetical protein